MFEPMPGRWEVRAEGNKLPSIVARVDNPPKAVRKLMADGEVAYQCIARLASCGDHLESNAQLLAAAPKMLAALAVVVGRGGRMDRDEWDLVNEAIEGATGMDPEHYARVAREAEEARDKAQIIREAEERY